MVHEGTPRASTRRPSTPSTWPSGTSGWSRAAPTSATCPRDEHFARYRDDPFTPWSSGPPVTDDVDVVIVGGGIAGVAGRRPAAQGRASSGSASSTRPAASAAPGTGTATRA